MKILVYDSGITGSQTDYIKATDLGYGVIDEAKHGSVVCDIIKLLSPNSEIESIKILDKNNTTTLEVLIDALNYGFDSDCDIICLALSIECEEDCLPLRKIIDNLDKQGKIIICSNMNRHRHSYPAAYENVIGCGIQYQSSDHRLFAKDRSIECSLPILAVWRKFENEGFIRLNGNSLSCAVMTGEIAYIMSQNKACSKIEIENKLSDMKWEDYQFYIKTSVDESIQAPQIIKKISNNIIEVMKEYNADITKPMYYSDKAEIILNNVFFYHKHNSRTLANIIETSL